MGKSKYIGTIVNGHKVLDCFEKRNKNGTWVGFFSVECVNCGLKRDVRKPNLFRGDKCPCISNYHHHGKANTRLYNVWMNMRARCTNPNHDQYKDYGGRGVSICKEWRDFQVFYDWSIVNGYHDDLEIDRKDNSGDYSPENCKWSTKAEQANNRRSSRLETMNGETHTLAQWAKMYGVKYGTVHSRMRRGLSLIEALTK